VKNCKLSNFGMNLLPNQSY